MRYQRTNGLSRGNLTESVTQNQNILTFVLIHKGVLETQPKFFEWIIASGVQILLKHCLQMIGLRRGMTFVDIKRI